MANIDPPIQLGRELSLLVPINRTLWQPVAGDYDDLIHYLLALDVCWR